MSKNIVVDSGFWFALFNERDEHHNNALQIETSLDQLNLVIPWPTLYETINTRFVKNTKCKTGLKRYIDRPSTIKVNDTPYKEDALITIMDIYSKRQFSAVDHIIRQILEDPDVNTDALITFNPADFYDVCYKNNIELISC